MQEKWTNRFNIREWFYEVHLKCFSEKDLSHFFLLYFILFLLMKWQCTPLFREETATNKGLSRGGEVDLWSENSNSQPLCPNVTTLVARPLPPLGSLANYILHEQCLILIVQQLRMTVTDWPICHRVPRIIHHSYYSFGRGFRVFFYVSAWNWALASSWGHESPSNLVFVSDRDDWWSEAYG